MTALSIQPPFPTFSEADGSPLEDGYIWIGTANLNPITTPISVYWDAALTLPAAQPIRTQGGYPVNSGTPARLYVNSDYSIQVQNSKGSVVYSAPAATERLSDVVVTGIDSSEVSFIQAGTGAVATTVQAKLRETVSVADFGADGVGDDTAAIQAALDTGADVIFPAASYTITAPLQVGSQRLFGGVVSKAINRAQTIINIAGNHACFINKSGEISFEIDGFYINFGATVPTNAGTSSNKIGFYFTTNTLWPAFAKISNCTVRGAWEAYYDNTGTYQSILERVFSLDCRRAFYKQNGTTIKFDTCMAQGGKQGFYIKDVLSPTLVNVAADQITPTVTENTANYFEGCRSLTIAGWDAESNVISGDALSYMRFVTSIGTITGFVGYLNTMSCSAGQEVYFIKADQGCRLHFAGCRTARNVGDLLFTGTGGNIATILAYDTTSVILTACDFAAPTGGTPTVRYSGLTGLVSSINFSQSNLDSVKVGTTELSDTEYGSWNVGLNSYTVTGTPVLTGRYVRVGKQVTCWADLNPNGGTIASTANTSALSGVPFTPTARTTCTVSDDATANTGVGIVSLAGLAYTPSWTASSVRKTVQFSYYIG